MIGYLANELLLGPLQSELSQNSKIYGDLVLTNESTPSSYWAQNIWLEPQLIKIESITDGARKLRSLQKHWSLYSYQLHRRAQLIAEKTNNHDVRPITFPIDRPEIQLGSWTLIDANTILASPKCTSLFPNGIVQFEEDRFGAPSRAYLKLWEAFTVSGKHPKKGDLCLDLGASPGGWTWVLAELGANVIAIDRSTLDPKLIANKNITFRKGDAFSINPYEFEHIDWLCCDVICYPDKLYTYIKTWIESGKCKNFVITLKFQGTGHYDSIASFASLPGGKVHHLFHNKHELTWISVKDVT